MPTSTQARARAREHVRDAEAVADLDQLAARDDDLAPLRERREREQDRGGVVVDDEGGLRTREPAEELGDVVLARAAAALGEVVLEVRVARGDLDDTVERRGRKRRAAEIRVDDDAGRVQDAAQARGTRGSRDRERTLDEVARLVAGAHLLARPVERLARGRDGGLVAERRQPLVAHERIHRGQVAQPHPGIVGAGRGRNGAPGG